jgi:hypothetical protein
MQLPAAVTVVSEGLFADCTALEHVILSPITMEIQAYAFNGCAKLTVIENIENISVLGDYAFSACSSLTSFTVPTNLTILGNGTFKDCTALQNVDLHAQLTNIGTECFRGCTSLVSVDIPAGVTEISYGLFADCASLTSVIVAHNSALKTIAYYAFYHCPALTTVRFGANSQLSLIDAFAFEYCTSLEKIVIPQSVTEFGRDPFAHCDNVTIYCQAQSMPASWASDWNESRHPVVFGYLCDDDHTHSVVITPPTCTQYGYTTHTCTDCGY